MKKTLLLLSGLFFGHDVFADPCGMVPPVSVNADTSIAREGAQRTYVFYKDGMETIALRPGFRGSVEDFGMLIPFPTPPALRKIEDDTFAHIEAAIAPPKVYVSQERYYEEELMEMEGVTCRVRWIADLSQSAQISGWHLESLRRDF